MMKTIATIVALATLTAAPAFAADVARTSVKTLDGQNVGPAFQTRGGTITYYVAQKTYDMFEFADNVVPVPSSVDIWNPAEVEAYLDDLGVTNINIILRNAESTCRLTTTDPDGSGCNVDNGVVGSVGEDRTGTDRPVNGGW